MTEIIDLSQYRAEKDSEGEFIDFFSALDEGGVFENFSQVSSNSQEKVKDLVDGNPNVGKNSFVYQGYTSFVEELFGKCFTSKMNVKFCTTQGIGILLNKKNYRIEGLLGVNCKIKNLSQLIKTSLGEYSVFDIVIINFNHQQSTIEVVFRDDSQIEIPYKPISNILECNP